MEYRKLGRSGLYASEISLGCWAIGGPSWREGNPVGWSGANDDDSLAGLRRAFELGINHLDSADVYGDGHSERVISRFLQEVPREKMIVATKVGWFRGTAPHAYQPVHIMHQLEQSLTNLKTDYIDLYYFHHGNFGPDDQWLESAAETVHKAKEQGKIRVVGQSAYSYADFTRVCPVTKPDVLQFHYNALGSAYDKDETNLFKWADEQDLGLVIFGPLAQGILLDKFDPENPPKFGEGDIRANNAAFTRERLIETRKRLQPLKDRFGGSIEELTRVALQYALAQSANACVIPGFKNSSQVEVNAQAAGQPLTAEDVALIRQALQG